MKTHAEPASDSERARASYLRLGTWGAFSTLLGALLSGPASLWLVGVTHPQPPWRDARTFVEHFHVIQTLPFFLGFFLVGGLLALLASLARLAPPEAHARALLAFGLGCAFTALVCFNYAVQTTFIPLVARAYTDADAGVLAAFTMSNPRSLGWCLELWAYGIVGLATWLAAPVFSGSPSERLTAALCTLNGPLSVGSALVTPFVPGWALTTPGLVAFGLWNLLVIALGAAAFVALRRRSAAQLLLET
jgi:hypothetical protein